jgi:hypothetical protein
MYEVHQATIYTTWMQIRSATGWANKIKLALERGKTRKAMAAMVMHVFWKFWKEHNSRALRHQPSLAFLVIFRIKEEARAWSLAGGMFSGNIITEE